MPATGNPSPYGLQRSELALAQYGIVRRDNLWVLPNDTPALIVEMVSAECDVRGMDYVFESDLA